MEGHETRTFTVASLAALVHGTIVGDGAIAIARARPLSEAGPGDITFVEDERHAKSLLASNASAAIVPAGLQVDRPGMQFIRVDRPLDAFATVLQTMRGPARTTSPGIHPTASISPTARLGRDIFVGPHAVIDDGVVCGDRCRIHAGVVIGAGCRVGDDAVLHPRVVLYADTIVGKRVVIHAGSVIGSDGFGFRHISGRHVRVPQLGNVEIGDDVEIGALTTVDRGTFETTRVGAGTKIDNHVQVAHNCQVGPHNLLVSQVGMAGSCKTGAYVVIAGQAGIRDHLKIGDGAVIGAMSGVMADVPPAARIMGLPAEPEHDARRIYATLHKLPELRQQIRELEDRLKELPRLQQQVRELGDRFDEWAGRRKSA